MIRAFPGGYIRGYSKIMVRWWDLVFSFRVFDDKSTVMATYTPYVVWAFYSIATFNAAFKGQQRFIIFGIHLKIFSINWIIVNFLKEIHWNIQFVRKVVCTFLFS